MLLLLSHSDTDLLSARAAGGPVEYRFANPARLPLADLTGLLADAELVVVRLLGGLRSWEDGLDAVRAAGKPVVVLSGEQAPDAQLMEASTVPVGVATEAHAYLAHGGPGNLEQLARFLSDTVLLTGHGFEAPAAAPTWGPLERAARTTTGPTVAVLYYRAHHMSGNTGFVDALCEAIEDQGAQALPLYVASLRAPEPELLDRLRTADAIVTTVLAAGVLCVSFMGPSSKRCVSRNSRPGRGPMNFRNVPNAICVRIRPRRGMEIGVRSVKSLIYAWEYVELPGKHNEPGPSPRG